MTLPPMPRLSRPRLSRPRLSRPRLRRLALLCLSLCLPLLGRAATAATLNVPSAAYPTIQSAVNAAASGDTVLLADGTYTGPGNVDVIIVGTGITVQSQNGAAKTIIDCGGFEDGDDSGNHRGFLLGSGSSATLTGLTITHGYQSNHQGDYGYGGAILIPGTAALTLNGCTLTNNYADYGAGLFTNSASTMLTLSGCAVTYNGSYYNGVGIAGGQLTMTGCAVTHNSSENGQDAGIEVVRANLTGCVISFNVSQYGIAGLSTSDLTATDCVIAHNLTLDGSGYACGGVGVGTANLTNCAIFGNQGGAAGGVLSQNAATLTNCTITANSASDTGSGVGGILAMNGLTLTNDIVYGDTGKAEISAMGTVSVTYSDVQQASGIYAGTGNLNADPGFPDPSTDQHLPPGSPCLGAGTPNGAPTTTLDGYARPNPPSIGAYELDTRAATTTALTSSLNPSAYGQSVTFTATVSGSGGAPTGSVTFLVNGQAQAVSPLSGGSASYSTSSLSGGAHSVTAVYEGDPAFALSKSAPLTQTVTRTASSTALTSSVNPSASDQSVTFTATVTGSSPYGTVTFSDGSYVLGTENLGYYGVATLTVYSFTAGSHPITAVFSGNGNNVGSTSPTLTQVVLAATAVTVTDATGTAGQTVTLSAQLKAGKYTVGGRKLSFTVDGTVVGTVKTNSSGVANLSYVIPSGTTVGSHTIGAAFAGDTTHAASSGTGTLTVTTAATILTVPTVSGSPGQTVTLTATLSRTTGGAAVSGETVSFSVDGGVVGTAVTNGAGLASLGYVVPAGDATGPHPILASFAGDGSFSASSGSGTLTVQDTTSLSVAAVTGTLGQTVTLSARLKSRAANLAGRTVSFTVDGVSAGSAVTNSSGVANLYYTIPAGGNLGSHAVGAAFAGDATYVASSGSGTLTVVKAATALTVPSVTGTHGKTVTLSARLKAGLTNLAGRTVAFTVDGTAVGSAVTNSSGVANLFYAIPAGATPGSHLVGAAFAGDGGDNAATGTGTLTVN